MRLAAVTLIAAACALGACQDRDAEQATPPVSPGAEPNAPAGQIPPPQPAPEGGSTGAQPAPGPGAPGAMRDPALPTTPPTLPEDNASPPPINSPQ